MAVQWSPAARADLACVFDFNLAFSDERAELVDARLIERADALETAPLIGRPTRMKNVREVSLTDIQYVMRYLHEGGQVTILRVHSAREMGAAL